MARHVRHRRRVGRRRPAADPHVGPCAAGASRHGAAGAVPLPAEPRAVAGAPLGDARQRRHLLLVQLCRPAHGPHLGLRGGRSDARRHAGGFRHVRGQYRGRPLCRPFHARAGRLLHARRGVPRTARHLLRRAGPRPLAGAHVPDGRLPFLRVVAAAVVDSRELARRGDARCGPRAGGLQPGQRARGLLRRTADRTGA